MCIHFYAHITYAYITNYKFKDQYSLNAFTQCVHLFSSGMNFQDLMVRQGAVDNPPKTPFAMGFECAGEVEGLGDNVQGFKVIWVSSKQKL